MEAITATLSIAGAHDATAITTLSQLDWEQVAGSLGLSPQQGRIVELILQGNGDKQIARHLGVSFGTLRAHLSRAFERTATSGRMELAALVFARLTELRSQKEGQHK